MNLPRKTGVVVTVAWLATALAGAARGQEVDVVTVDVGEAWLEADIALNDDLLEGPGIPVEPGTIFDSSLMGDDCEEIAFARTVFFGIDRARGNFYQILRYDVTLDAFALCVTVREAGETDLWFTIHEKGPEDPDYKKIVEKTVPFEGPTEPVCFQSGPIEREGNPVILFEKYKYIISVAWDDRMRVGHYLLEQEYPQPFSAGLVLGAFTRNGRPPLPGELDNNPYTGGAHWMKLCYGPNKGACCTDGECEMEFEDDCGGEFTAENVTCEEVEEVGGCEGMPHGACCFGMGCEEDMNPFACAAAGGEFQDDGSTCANDCPMGACCKGEDDCRDPASEAHCDDIGGNYRGDGTKCEGIEPPCGYGACCVLEGCLDRKTEQFCLDRRGTFRGDGTTCVNLDPLCPGTCCWGFGRCEEDVTPEDCETEEGSKFLGYAVFCENVEDCDEIKSGACCLEDDRCFTTAGTRRGSEACDDLKGSFRFEVSCEETQCDLSCELIRRLKVTCRDGSKKVKALVKSDLSENTRLTLTLDEKKSRVVTINRRGKGKTKWRRVAEGDHEVCIDECPGRCGQTNCAP